MLSKKQKDLLGAKIENEGFDYCFGSYSSFPEIKDPEFREKLDEYLAARKEFGDFLVKEEVIEEY